MQFHFVKVCSATPTIRVADTKYNIEQIQKLTEEAIHNGAQLVVFPELCVTGYTCGDLFNQIKLLEQVEKSIKELCSTLVGKNTLVFVGAPVIVNHQLYNCAIAIHDGKILGIVPKTALPNYGEFYELRHFCKGQEEVISIHYAEQDVAFGKNIIFSAKNESEFTVACELCEDLWTPNPPSVDHALAGANIIVNLSCSDETVGKAEYRKNLVSMQSARLISGYIYTDSGDGESTTDMVFAGHNLICENGTILKQSGLFENGLIYAEIDVERLANERRRVANSYYAQKHNKQYKVVYFETENREQKLVRVFSKTPFVPQSLVKRAERTELILTIQAKGLEKRLTHTHAKTAVIGISGGLDSALALLVTARAFDHLGLDKKNIIAITMPGFGTTGKTYQNSLHLIEAIGATSKTVSIADSVNQHFKDIEHDPKILDVTYENSQARMRTLILMNTANKMGGMVIGTGDMSELALGWATYNGDHMSMYGVNCSVPKTLVKHLVSYEAERVGGELKRVLVDILNTEISPELLPPTNDGKIAQKTEDLVGPYILHDFFLYYIIRWGYSPQKVLYLAEITFVDMFVKQTIHKWLKNFYKRFFQQQFKRSCIPDGVKVGSVALSPRGDWRMPSDAMATIWLDEIQ